MLHSPFADSVELAVLALGNVAGDSVALRDTVLRTGAVENIAEALKEHNRDDVPPSFAEHATWALANMFKGKPAPSADVLKPAIPELARLATDEHDQTAANAIWALSFYTDGGEHVEDILEQNMLPGVVRLLDRGNEELSVPVSRLLANVSCGDEDATTALLDTVTTHYAIGMLDSGNVTVRKEMCWMVANVAAGTSAHVQALLDEQGLVQKVISVALCAAEAPSVLTEAHYALANLVLCSNEEQLKQLVQMEHFLRALCRNPTIDSDASTALVQALVRVKSVLDKPGSFEAENRTFVTLLVESGADDTLRSLKDDPSLQSDIDSILSCLDPETKETTSTEENPTKPPQTTSEFDDIDE